MTWNQQTSLAREGSAEVRSSLSDAVGELQMGELRAALRIVLWTSRGPFPERFLDRQACGMLSGVCAHARGAGMAPEQLLILVKSTWRDLPGRRPGDFAAEHDMLSRVVSTCIREYFGHDQQVLPARGPDRFFHS